MAKKKDKKGKLPKEIAGIKIPKEFRKTGEALIATANSPAGRELLMSGAAAMIAGLATRMRAGGQPGSGTAPHMAPPPRETETNDNSQPGFDPEAAGAKVAQRIIDVIGMAANSGRRTPGSGPASD